MPALPQLLALLTAGTLLSACGGGGSTPAPTPTPTPATYTIGGTVAGLTGAGLVLQNNAGNNLSVAAGSTTFSFTTAVNAGAAYAVTVQTQPTGQTCTVGSGSGNANANVTNVAVTCTTNTVTIGGTISGLTAAGLVLQNNAGSNLTVAANATSFTFPTAVNAGSAYAVTVQTQPTGLACTVANGSGTASTNITTVALTCASTGGGGGGTTTATVGGGISGLSSGGLVLQLNGANDLAVSSVSTSFVFPNTLSTGAAYAVTVKTQPSGPLQTCVVANGSGTIASASITNVQLTCTTNRYTIGGTITTTGGTLATGLVLQNILGDDLTVPAGATTFQFATGLVSPSSYSVSIKTQPTGQTCTLVRALGVVLPSNVTNVAVTCTNSRTATALNGTYSISAGGSALRGYLTFFSDGTYVFGLHRADPGCNNGAGSNGNGVEYGVYSFNSGTGVLTWVTTAVDTNEGCGINDTIHGTVANGIGFAKNAGTGVITGTLVDPATTPATNFPVTLTPVASTSGQLLGSYTANKLGFIVYNSDSTVFSAGTQTLQGASVFVAGIEDACLNGVVPTAATGSYTANFTASCLIPGISTSPAAVDTNGTAGLSGNASTTYSVTGDTLTTTAGTTPAVTLSRVLVN